MAGSSEELSSSSQPISCSSDEEYSSSSIVQVDFEFTWYEIVGPPLSRKVHSSSRYSDMSLLDDYDVDTMDGENLCPHMRELVTLSVTIKGSLVLAWSLIDPSHWYCAHCNEDCPDLPAVMTHSDTME